MTSENRIDYVLSLLDHADKHLQILGHGQGLEKELAKMVRALMSIVAMLKVKK